MISFFSCLIWGWLFAVSTVHGFPEIGIHAGIKNDIRATSAGWLTVSGWWIDDDETDDSFKSSYKNDLVLESTTYVAIPITGIYLVSASVPIESIDTTLGSTFTLAMVNGDDLTLSELALQSTVRKTVGTVTTLVLSGFCEYHAGESVSFRIYSESDGGYLVTPGGKMSIHYIGSTQTAPAFLVQVDNDYNVTSLGGEIVKPYVSSGRAKLFAYLTGLLTDSGTYVTACDGVFYLASNIMIQADAGTYTLEMLIDDQVSASYKTQVTSSGNIVPLNVFESMKVAKGVVISLRISASTSSPFKVLKYSSWSLGFIGKEVVGLQEFSVFLPFSLTAQNSDYNGIPVHLQSANSNISATNTRGQFISPSNSEFNRGNVQFNIEERANFFYVTGVIHISGPTEDVELVIPVSLQNDERNLAYKGLTARVKKIANGVTTLSVSATIVIADGQFLSIYVKAHDGKEFTVMTSSYISFIQMRYLTSSFSVKTNDVIPMIFNNQQWNDALGPFTSYEKGSFAFAGDFNTLTGKFTSSHTGIHMVQANLRFKTTNCTTGNALIQANLAIDNEVNINNGFYSMQQAPMSDETLRFYGTIKVVAGQTLSLKLRLSGCANPSYSVQGQWGASYIGTNFITPAFLGIKTDDKPFTTKTTQFLNVSTSPEVTGISNVFATDDQFDGNTYKAMEDAIFIISANALVENLVCTTNTYVAIRFLVSGIGNEGGTTVYNERDLNIRDVKYVTNNQNTTLSLSTALRLKDGETVKVQFIESTVFPEDTVTTGTSVCSSITLARGSSFSVLRWSSSAEISSEGYRNSGFLASDNSGNRINTNGWDTFATNSLRHATGFPGFFAIGNSLIVRDSSFSVNLIAKAGVYYVTGSITLDFEDGFKNSQYEMAALLNGEFETGIRTTSYSSSSSKYLTLTFGGFVHLMYGQSTSTLNLKVKGASSYYIYKGSTFSIIKLQPDYKTPGFVTEVRSSNFKWAQNSSTVVLDQWKAENSKGLTVNNIGYNHKNASYIVQLSGFYVVDINVILDKNLTSITGNYKLSILQQRNSSRTSIGHTFSVPEFHTTLISKLVLLTAGDKITVEFETEDIANNTEYSGGYSLYFAKSSRDFVGFRSKLGQEFTAASLSSEVSGWESVDTTSFYNGEADNDTVVIAQRNGQYIVSFNPVTNDSSVQDIIAEILVNDKVGVSGTASGKSVNIPLSITFKLAINDTVKFVIKGSSFPPKLQQQTSRSLAYIAPLSRLSGGLSLYTKSDSSGSSKSVVVGGLYGDGGDGYFLGDNSTLVNNEAIAIIKPGFYRVNAHIKVNNTGPASNFQLQTVITNIDRNLENFMSVVRLETSKAGTLIVSGVVPLRKFDNVQFKVTSSDSVQFTILVGSTASVVVLDDNTGPAQCEEVRVFLKNLPTFQRLQVRENVTFKCEVTGNKVADEFSWRKNGVVISGETTSTLTFDNLALNDSGVFSCTAKFFDVTSSTNNGTLEVYDPYPTVNATENRGYAYVIEENKLSMILVTFDVLAFMFTPKDTQAIVSLHIISGDPNGDFNFSMSTNTTVSMHNSRPLDYERINFYKLTVRATNLEEPGASSKPGPYFYDFQVNVTVLNLNDNAPVFLQNPYVAEIPENLPVSTVVATVTANDLDGDRLTYTMLSNISTPYFAIDNSTGVVTVKTGLDRESITNHSLFIVAYDGIHTAVTELLLVVTDVNDNHPTFADSGFVIKISEATHTPTVVLKVIATDPDLGNNSTLTYTILLGNEEGKFNLDASTGNLSLVQPLNYENTTLYVLTITVEDQGTPTSLSSLRNLTVTIMVVDHNDNNPIFTQSLYQTTISETRAINSIVISVQAIDGDGTPQHSTVGYQITDPLAKQYFSIGANGSISLIKQLDYTEHTEFRFAVQSNDGLLNTSRHLTTTVVIKITDENNKAPVIYPSVYNITISEGTSVGTSIGHVNATDEDTVGILTFTASGTDSAKFMIMSTTGAIHLRTTLDYELVPDRLLTFNVTCSDGVASTYVTVNIIVTDANDNEPVFTRQYYIGSIREDKLAGYSILQVSANDSDAMHSNESMIRYSIEIDAANPSTSIFIIDATTGEVSLRLNNSLDYETQWKHQFKVIATDMGDIYQLSGYATVVINVEDVNDNNPDMLSGTQTISVKETHLSSQPLLTFMARDNDAVKTLSFHIISGNDGLMFKIRDMYLELNNTLDYETQQSYNLTVVARDTNNLESGIARVIVNVVPVNEHHPFFPTSYIRREVYENSGLQALIDVNATDLDKHVSTLQYTMLNSSDFVINPSTGVISNVVNLDYERQRWYSMVVIVSDQDAPHLQAQAFVDIIVLDRNDEAPVFNPIVFNIKISEKAPKDMVITMLKAYDNDTAIESLTFGSSDIDVHFSLDSSSGMVTLASEIDLENAGQTNYEMHFYVYDGVNMCPQNATLNVIVVDVNDNEPIFTKNEYVIYIPENTASNTELLSVTASDRDGNVLNSDRVYTLVGGRDSANFTLLNTNKIYSNVRFDYESVREYSFMVQANNSGSADMLTGRALVRVIITDVNDNIPLPSETNIHVNVSEATKIGSLLVAIHATDVDSTSNGQLSYSIISNATMFTINGNGEIRLAKGFDRVVQDSFHLMVNVTDGGLPQLWAIVNVSISVMPVTSNIQLATIKRGEILENVPIGHSILYANSTSRSKQVTYQLVSSQDSTKFSVNTTTGEVTTKDTFDYETKRAYLFQVIVMDAMANMTGRSQVLINVLDVNDNTPVLNSASLTYNISEATRIDSVITSIKFTDADSMTNGQVDFTLVGGDGVGTFKVSSTGYVTLNGSLDYRLKNHYTLLIKGEDRGTPYTLHSNITININVFKANVDFNVLVFNQSYYHGCVNENQAHLNFITVYAINQNPIVGTTVTYSFVAGTPAEITSIFTLNSSTGALSSTNALDYEKRTSYEIVVVATNNEGYRDTSVVDVCVNDVRDNPYTFKENNIVLNLTESTPVNSLIYRLVVLDNDTIDSGSRSFIVNNGVIRVDNRGFVYLNQQLDYEGTKQYTSIVTVRYLSNNDDTSTITINVLDWNDNRPIFSPQVVTFTVNEDASANHVVGTVSAGDLDQTISNNNRTYALVSSSDLFTVLTNGTIMVKSSLLLTRNDTVHEIIIKAYDSGYLNLIGTVRVVITIVDTNNNRPVFESNTYSNRISEEAPIGSKVLCVKATDGDFNIGNVVSYFLHDVTNTFSIDSNTGEITVAKLLDYEQVQFYTMHVEARDDLNLRSATNATVTITIIDVNDNLPTFNLTMYTQNVTENTSVGSNILTIDAVDNDLTGNSLTYEIVANKDTPYFTLSARTLKLQKSLDYEMQREFTFLVQAEDAATKMLYGRSLVVIYVVDANDNTPEFNVNLYNVTISEAHLVNQLVVEIGATDRDADSVLTYTFNPAGTDSKFAITSTNNLGQITLVQAVNYDMKNKYEFTVTVSDGTNTSPPMSVTVHVTPVDKPEPVFNQTMYIVSIYENTTINTMILDVNYYNVITPVTSLTINGAEGTNNFAITISGRISNKVTFDYDVKSQYLFTITVADKRGRQGHATVIVNILNNNDLCPKLHPEVQSVQITEPTADNTIVAVVRATDRDSQNLTFALTSTSNNVLNNRFKIDLYGGIRANGDIDIENTTMAALEVTVSDGVCTKKATVHVFINPVTACPVCRTYQFVHPVYYAYIDEEIAQNGLVTVMTNRHSHTNYSISNSTALTHVRIGGRNGVIDVTNAFDYETTKTWEFTVTGVASIIQNPEETVTMYTRVVIIVRDVDDNCPSFTTPSQITTRYSSPIKTDTIVGRVQLADSDSQYNHVLSVTDSTNFKIDSNGNIRTARILESLVQLNYSFNVTATNSRCTVISQVALTLEVHPTPMTYMFTDNGNYEETVFENKGVVSKFTIVPRIQGNYSPVAYSIVETTSMFAINSNSGELSLTSALDYETQKKHIFTVKATIKTIFEAYATVIINVLNVNDECPTMPSSITIKYRGNPDKGDVIGKVSATDSDSTSRYSMLSGLDLTVNATTGDISTTKTFPYSYKKDATYSVTASDLGNNCPPVTTEIVFDFETCSNPEDYQFTKSRYVQTYFENHPLGALFTVSIRNVTIARTYSIEYPTGAVQRYAINSTTGAISLVQSLNYEVSKEENFMVKAVFSDGVISLTEVTIFVLDVNDECPGFSTSSTTVYITEPIRAGTFITKASVTDKDTARVNAHTFSLAGDSAFQIDSNGVVTVKAYYTSTHKVSTYQRNLTITVSDGSCSPRTHLVTVIIYKVLLQEYFFNKPLYKYEISEDQTVPHLIDCFKNLYNNTGVYRLKYTNSTCFSLSSTGDLKLINPLDYEAHTHHYLDVEVEYANGFVAHSGVVVTVRNVNDNKPQTFPYPSTASINPSFARHTMVGEIDVVDADRERTDKNTFVFSIDGGDPKEIFAISQTGQIYTKRCMSGTDVGIYHLRIKVNDGRYNVYEGMTVGVFDVGDSAFSKSCPVSCSDFGNPTNYMFSDGLKMINVPENTNVGTALLSVDINAFPNATFSLSSHANGYFMINASNGTIYLNNSLNYETHRVHYFTVTAHMNSRVAKVYVTSKVAVMIIVQNVEDNRPVVKPPSSISISELTVPGTVVGYLRVEDADTPTSSLSFMINTSYPNALSVNNHGEIRVNNLTGVVHNADTPLFYSVSDGTYSSSGVFMFRVVDVNNNVPMFTKNVYSFDIKEGVVGDVGFVSASDKDASQSTVTYSIDSVSSVNFVINSTTGVLSTRTKLDYETKSNHHVTVMAIDSGGYVGVAIASVTVYDVNDHTPMFVGSTSSFISTVNENTATGSIVAWIKVHDADQGANVTFSLDTASSYFAISNSGVVTLTKALYTSSNNVHTLAFTATDQVHPISGVLTVNVARGSFSTCPIVTGFDSKVIDVPESQSVNSVLLDLGSLVNSPYYQYSFQMATGSPPNFEIVGNNLRLKAAVDYENLKKYSFTVHALDATRNTTIALPVLVNVVDIDETAPTISTSAIIVSEFTKVGSVVGIVQASDADGTAAIKFELRNSDGTFAIDEKTGAITLLKALDGAKQTSYLLQTCVTSSGVQTCRNITTTVSNINSNGPDFGIPSMDITVSSQAVVGTVVSNTSATDGDGNPITYSINALADATVTSIFEVNPSTGQITLKAKAIPGQYHFFLVATDGTHHRTLPVTVTVPVNNGGQTTPPHFKNTVYSVTIFSDATTFVQVQALDAPDTASLIYSIESGNTGNVFTIDAITGEISRNTGATLTTGALYKLMVTARNKRSNLNGTVPVYIAVGSRIVGGSGLPSSFVQEVSATSLLLNVSLRSFDENHVVGFLILGQEYPTSIDVSIKTQMEPVTYFQAFNSTNTVLYRYRLYYVANITLAEVTARRTRRSLESATADIFAYRVGVGETTCSPSQTICNGPLRTGTAYRFVVVAVYNNGNAPTPLLVYSPISNPSTTSGQPTTGPVTGGQTSVHVNALVVWIVALVVLGTLFWLAVLALAIVLCYKRRYSHDKAYDLGYNGPPVPSSRSAYAFENKAIIKDTSIHYSEASTMADYQDGRPQSVTKVITTHAPVVLDSPEHSPPTKINYEESTTTFTQQEFETHSAKMKFDDENPEWESMAIQLRIDPTGERDPVITGKETKKEDRHDVEDITTTSTTIRQVVNDNGDVVEEIRTTTTDELSRL